MGIDGQRRTAVGVFAALVVSSWFACHRRTTPPVSVEPEPSSVVESPQDAPAAPSSNPPDSAPACQAGGRVWNGRHEGCTYEVDGCCYDDPASACLAAGCPDRCQVIEMAPAQIRCRDAPGE